MRLVMFFETREKAREFMKKHKEYRQCDKVEPPIQYDDGRQMKYVATAIVD